MQAWGVGKSISPVPDTDMLDAAEDECAVQASLREDISADLERRLAVVERLVKEVQARPPPGTESKDKPPPPPSPELDNYEAGEPIKSPSQMMNVKDGERERELRAELRRCLAPNEVSGVRARAARVRPPRRWNRP